MLNQEILRNVLCKVFFGDENYIPYVVPMVGNWWQPSHNPDANASYIGYTIYAYTPQLRTENMGNRLFVPVKTGFQIATVGPQAEELIKTTLWWDERRDVIDAFGEYKETLCYIPKRIYSVRLKQEGFNDTLSWRVDLQTIGDMVKFEKQGPWFPVKPKPIGG